MSKGTVTCLCVVAIICIVFAVLIAYGETKLSIHADAVRVGVGEYVVVDNLGNTEFQWVVPQEDTLSGKELR